VVAYRNSQWLGYYAERGCLHRLGAYRFRTHLCETRLLVSFTGSITRNKFVGVVWGLVYANQVHWHCWGGELSESKLLVSFRGSGARIEAVGIVWGIGYAKQSCLCCFGAGLCDTGLLMLLGH